MAMMKKEDPTVEMNKIRLLRCFFLRYLMVWKNTNKTSRSRMLAIEITGHCESPKITRWSNATLRRKE